jgi:protein-S-isoprenylcysteine O-methyltransferase Ste14
MSTFEALLDKAQGRLPPELRRGGKAYDFLAALTPSALYGFSAVMQAQYVFSQLATQDIMAANAEFYISLLAKISTFLLAIFFAMFLLIRRTPIAGERGFVPRLITMGGAYLGVVILMIPAGSGPIWLNLMAMMLVTGGAGFAVYAISFLGRSVSLLPEARKLVVAGPYAYIRHPLYLGEQLALLGAVLQQASLLAFFLLALQCICQLYRMQYEEKILEQAFPDYAQYKARTERLLPGVY